MKVFNIMIHDTEADSSKCIYVSAENMAQAISKVSESKIAEMTSETEVCALDSNYNLSGKSIEECKVYSMKKMDGSVTLFPVKDPQDIINKVTGEDEAIEVSQFTDKAFII